MSAKSTSTPATHERFEFNKPIQRIEELGLGLTYKAHNAQRPIEDHVFLDARPATALRYRQAGTAVSEALLHSVSSPPTFTEKSPASE